MTKVTTSNGYVCEKTDCNVEVREDGNTLVFTSSDGSEIDADTNEILTIIVAENSDGNPGDYTRRVLNAVSLTSVCMVILISFFLFMFFSDVSYAYFIYFSTCFIIGYFLSLKTITNGITSN